MSYRICLIPGDGIGREVVPAGRRLLEATGLPIEFVEAEAGWETFQRLGTALPDETLAASRSADATLFGAVSSPSHPVEGYRSPIVALRRALDLYANLRPVMSQPIEGSRPNIDMLIVRENSEGLYSGRERTEEGEAVTERVITRCGSARIVRLACRLAMSRRRRVTVVHKANVLRATCGLFRTVALEVAAEHSDVQVDELLVDPAAMRLFTSPETFDVLVSTNLVGDILSDEAAALVGGLGLAPSGNIGEDTALFEPVHGSAPDIAGRGIANPAATFLAVAMMLDHLGQNEIASRVRTRVEATLREGILTPDLGGTATTEEVTRAVVDALGDEPN